MYVMDIRISATIAALLLGLLAATAAVAEPDRDSLIEAWEAYVVELPGTVVLEEVEEGVYRYEDTDLPYEGQLKLVGALVRSAEMNGMEGDFSHFGMVDFELVDLPAERLSSQSYYYWLADRQTLHYSEEEQRWVDPATYQRLLTEQYTGATPFGVMTFMLNYGIWVLLIGLLLFVFIAFNRQTRKARGLMDETASINQQARENLDRAASMQDEVMEIARQSRDLQSENNALLKQMLNTMQR